MSFDLRFDIRHILSASLISAAMAMPALAQDAAPATTEAPAATTAEAAPAISVAPTPALVDDLFLG